MPEDHEQEEELRRYGPKDRKTRLTSGPLFPEDDTPLPEPEELVADTSAIIGDQLAEPLPDVVERFPPVRPVLDDDQDVRKSAPKTLQKRVIRRRRGDWRHNLVAMLFFIATLALAGYFTLIWNNPWSSLNPMAPPTDYYLVTETPNPFAAMNATETAAALITPTAVEPLTSFGGLPFSLVDAGVVYMPNSNSSGCDWASIAGTVTGLNGEPLPGYRISISDATNPDGLSVEVFSGAVPTFGEGGFEYVLGSAPRSGRYDIQLFNATGAPVSDVYRIVTRDNCDQNIAVVNFIQIAPM